ncbi:structural maintenance of chromosomes protein 6-like isoform X2 [Stegodyphus dumicola]|uniref:structural maintenance of chromosomes protein 6-like isoform X2 n=1 Tax=Stegodyphus dumicola TaxID=202533 RepID=UPI0015A8BCF0|nr:structural maintenance of chromosomes protein 6-like isoform X2 [Stegodyphus dumicola]
MKKKRFPETLEVTSAEKRLCALKAAELGIIESVSLQNFMCHDNLKFEFGPHVNFIIGANGSGKSAVLTGIILALGGRSSLTGRYGSVKGFIKNGKRSAVVTVTLKNCGISAYKPDEYGDKITVERSFSTEGNSLYKIRSAEGRVISTSKEELNNILTMLDIHLDNPITILTQETSRSFLISKNAGKEKLYQLFYEGTGLQKLQENYQRASELRDQAKADLEKKRMALPEMEKEIEQWENLLTHAEKVKDLEVELLWAIAIEVEKKLWEIENKYDKIVNEIRKVSEEKKRSEEKLGLSLKNVENFSVKQRELNMEIMSKSNALSKLKSEEENLCKDIREHRGLLDRYKRQRERLHNDITLSQNALNEALQKDKDDTDAEQRKREEEIQILETELLGIKSKLEEKSKAWRACLEQEDMLKQKLSILEAEKGMMCLQKKTAQNELMHLKNSIDNKSAFGPEIENCLREIAHCGGFKKSPKGPIGLYLEILDQKWSFAVEVCLTDKLLRAFCCDNSQDAKLLGRILNKHFHKTRVPSVIVSKYLESARIENIILIDNRDAAMELMMNAPPMHCSSTFLENGDQILPKPYRYYSCTKKHSSCLLRSFCQEDIREKEAEIQALDGRINDKTHNIDSIRDYKGKYSETRKTNEEDIAKLRCMEGEVKQKLEAKRKVEKPVDLSDMRSDLDHHLKEKEKIEEKIKDCEAHILQKSAELSNLRTASKAEWDNIVKKQQENQLLITEIKNDKKKVDLLTATIQKYESTLKTLGEKEAEYAKETSETRKKAELATRNAEQFCARINTNKSPSTIEQRLRDTKKALEEASNCDREDLRERYEEKKAKLEKAKSELKAIESNIIILGEMMDKRIKKFKVVLQQTKLCLSLSFTTTLAGNRFEGELIFDDVKRTLILKAAPKTDRSKKQDYTCQALSGGERSFVTICFLLSLWERIEMPFRILDEYDVFMDSEKRHLSVTLLTKTAEQKKDVQFIFLSPLELPPMKDLPHIKVHIMPPPKRKRADDD